MRKDAPECFTMCDMKDMEFISIKAFLKLTAITVAASENIETVTGVKQACC